MPNTLLEIEGLHTYFMTKEGIVKAVNGVSFKLEEDSILGVVGESGSGKTVTALSVLQLVPFPGRIVEGSIRFKGENMPVPPTILVPSPETLVEVVLVDPASSPRPSNPFSTLQRNASRGAMEDSEYPTITVPS